MSVPIDGTAKPCWAAHVPKNQWEDVAKAAAAAAGRVAVADPVAAAGAAEAGAAAGEAPRHPLRLLASHRPWCS